MCECDTVCVCVCMCVREWTLLGNPTLQGPHYLEAGGRGDHEVQVHVASCN